MSEVEQDKLISVQYILYGHETPLAELEKQLKTDMRDGLRKEEAKKRSAA